MQESGPRITILFLELPTRMPGARPGPLLLKRLQVGVPIWA